MDKQPKNRAGRMPAVKLEKWCLVGSSATRAGVPDGALVDALPMSDQTKAEKGYPVRGIVLEMVWYQGRLKARQFCPNTFAGDFQVIMP